MVKTASRYWTSQTRPSITAADSITDTASLELDGALEIAIYDVWRQPLRSTGYTLTTASRYWTSQTPADIIAAGSITDTTSLELQTAHEASPSLNPGAAATRPSPQRMTTASRYWTSQTLPISPQPVTADDGTDYHALNLTAHVIGTSPSLNPGAAATQPSQHTLTTASRYWTSQTLRASPQPAALQTLPALNLTSARGIDVFESGGNRYAAVAAHLVTTASRYSG